MPEGTSGSLTVEQVMQRIRERAHLQNQAGDSGSKPVPAYLTPSSQTAPQLSLYDLRELRHNVAANNVLWNQVGTINPRLPGWHNHLLQLLKKGVRRLLTWYTCPLHHFNASVTRSLNETVRALEALQEQISDVQTTKLAAAAALGERLGQLEQTTPARLEALQEQISDVQTTKLAAAATLGERLGQLEQTTPARLEALQNQLIQQVEAIQQSQLSNTDNLRQGIGNLLAQIEQLRGQAETVTRQMRRFQDDRIYERLRLSERSVRRLVHLLEDKGELLPVSPAPPLPIGSSSHARTEADLDYFWFQERFRGDETDVKERQRIYLDYFRGRSDVLDLGCGRGEFLELLRESDISARGIDTNPDMVLLCREKGLNVVQEDLFSYLESIPDESVGGIFSAQVIEHLTTGEQLRLINLARKKLLSGCPLVLETINPECLFALARHFFLDPTHVRPVHPELLRFLLEGMHFANIELKFSAPVESGRQLPKLVLPQPTPELDRFNQALEHMNTLLFGYQDYAAVAWR